MGNLFNWSKYLDTLIVIIMNYVGTGNDVIY